MKLLAIASLALFGNLASAVEWNVIDDVYVSNIRAQGQRDVISFITTEPIFNPGSCASPDHYVIYITEEVSNQMLSLLLSAAATEKSIGINVHSGECFMGRPVVLDVWINY